MKKKIPLVAEVNVPDMATLGEYAQTIDILIKQYGEYAKLVFDAGYNNISTHIEYTRDETDDEEALRAANEARLAELDKERSKLSSQINKINAERRKLQSDIVGRSGPRAGY